MGDSGSCCPFFRDRFVRYLKSIYLLNGTDNIPLAHSFGVHAQNLILDPTDILGTFGD